MKTLIKVLVIILIISSISSAQRVERTIADIQRVSIDSLLLADAIQLTNTARWTLQSSPYRWKTSAPAMTDTITLTALCLVPPKIITYTGAGWTMILSDTAQPAQWSNIFVRVPSGDTINLMNNGFLNVTRGDIIRITGVVEEFLVDNMNSLTQFRPIPGVPIEILDNVPEIIAPPIPKVVTDFHQGVGMGGTIKYSTGEPFEMAYVELTNLTVNYYVAPLNGTFNMVDADGNEFSTYDVSGYYTLRIFRNPLSTYTLPSLNTKVDTIRGYIWTSSGTENPRGYRICPMYPGDIVFGAVLPGVATVRRYPVLVTPTDSALVTARVYQQPGGAPIDSAKLFYSINNAAFKSVKMTTIIGDSVGAYIPVQTANAFVRYYVTAYDNAGYTTTIANASPDYSTNSARGLFFYYVLDRQTTIRDIQYNPFTHGRGPLTGAIATASGIITADTTQLGLSPNSTFPAYGTTVWYLQTGKEPWNGIWISSVEPTMGHVNLGDSVTVTGIVSELNEVTNLYAISDVQVHSSGNPIPSPNSIPCKDIGFGVSNGTPSAEKWEGMLIQLNDLTVTNIYPTFVDPSEYEVSDGTGSVIIRRDGKNNISNVPGDTVGGIDFRILNVGDKISYIRGLLHYSARRYKLVPRTNADFGVITSVQEIPNSTIPTQHQLTNNYPNPFNPKTVIEYSLPKEEFVTLKVYNIIGQEVATLKNEVQKAGSYRVNFDGSKLASGVYFYRLQTSSFTQIKKMALVK